MAPYFSSLLRCSVLMMAANPVVYPGFMHEPVLNPKKALCAKPSYRIRGLAGRTAAELTGLSARGEGIAGVFGRAAMAAMARFHQRQVLAERTA